MGQGFTTVMTTVWEGIASVVTTITEQPLLLIPVGLGFAGSLIGLARMLMRGRKGK